MKIIPAILVKSQADFLQQIHAIKGVADMIHLDIADGEFVPETTWADPKFIGDHLKIDCELHLMVKNPLAVIEQWNDVPQVRRILFHAESGANMTTVIEAIHDQSCEAIAVLNPETPSTAIDSVANELDGVMAMTIHPGAQGRAFMPEILSKLAELKKNHPHLITQVDGGVNNETLSHIKQAGIDLACVGSAIFGHGVPAENLAHLKKLIV